MVTRVALACGAAAAEHRAMRALPALLLLLALPAAAQTVPPAATPPEAPPASAPTPTPTPTPTPPARLSPEAARKAELDRLFEALKSAPDPTGAALVEARIRALWGQAASPAVVLLLRRGVRNLEARVPEEAVEDFDASITLAPDFAEGWLLRARALSMLGDSAAAARDLQEVLRLEPRHFGALLALSSLQEERGDLAGALRSLQAALEIHPRLAGGEERLRDLRRRAQGDAT
jgi:tetratricopeptide (TPR) repeat protein